MMADPTQLQLDALRDQVFAAIEEHYGDFLRVQESGVRSERDNDFAKIACGFFAWNVPPSPRRAYGR